MRNLGLSLRRRSGFAPGLKIVRWRWRNWIRMWGCMASSQLQWSEVRSRAKKRKRSRITMWIWAMRFGLWERSFLSSFTESLASIFTGLLFVIAFTLCLVAEKCRVRKKAVEFHVVCCFVLCFNWEISQLSNLWVSISMLLQYLLFVCLGKVEKNQKLWVLSVVCDMRVRKFKLQSKCYSKWGSNLFEDFNMMVCVHGYSSILLLRSTVYIDSWFHLPIISLVTPIYVVNLGILTLYVWRNLVSGRSSCMP